MSCVESDESKEYSKEESDEKEEDIHVVDSKFIIIYLLFQLILSI